jgi:PBP1b-binding outer membrane lipoprotein LpoB
MRLMKQYVLIALTAMAMLIVGCSQQSGGGGGSAAKAANKPDSEAKPTKVQTGSAPANVTAAFQKDHANTMIKKVEKETYANGTVHYEFTYIDASGRTQTAEYSADGEELPEH